MYEFRCRKAETTTEVHHDSPCQQLRGENILYLDRQRPSCGKDEVLTGFRLHSGGCHGNHMRYRTYCAKVYQPWQEWGRELKADYQTHYRHWWDKYSKKLAEYKHLSMPNSMSGRRDKREYEPKPC